MSRCHNWPEIGHSTTNVWSVSVSSVHCPANVLLNIMLHYNSTENPKIRQFSFYLQLWAKVNVSPGCRVRLIQSNGQKIIWGPRGRGLCKLLPCSPTSLFISNPKLENITKNITAYSNKWLHFGNNGKAGPNSANNGQRIKYKNPVTLDGALFVDYCHDGSSSLVAGPAPVSMSNNIIIGRSQRVSFVSEGHLDILQSPHNNIYFHTTVSSSLLLSLVTLCQ